MTIEKHNAEGYSDPTPHAALTNIEKEGKASKLPLVYVCSAYAGDVEGNTKRARAYSKFAVDHHAIPLAPHLLFPQFMNDGDPAERKLAERFNSVLLGKCDELWVFVNNKVISPGMQREIDLAKKKGIKTKWFYTGDDC